jgi:hypothetical protein
MKSFCQASDQAFWPSLESKEESVTIAVKPEMAATNAYANALTSTRTPTLRNRIEYVANSVTIFQRNHILPSEHPRFDRAYTWLFLFFCLAAVTIIATLQIEQCNKTANYLHQKITPELILDGQYTCACTLPQNLLALHNSPIQTVSNSDLRRCYSKDELSKSPLFNSTTIPHTMSLKLSKALTHRSKSHTPATRRGGFFWNRRQPSSSCGPAMIMAHYPVFAKVCLTWVSTDPLSMRPPPPPPVL